jgi:hypothetical protein
MTTAYKHIQRGWRTIGGKRIFFRSRWEANYARYLEWEKSLGLIKDWEHEPKTFDFPIKRGCNTYKPDFRVLKPNGSHHWVEVKGWLDSKSKTKIKRFKRFYPEEEIRIIDAKWFKSKVKNLKGWVDGWE